MNIADRSMTETIENISQGLMPGGYKCPYCGEVVFHITYAHAEKHGMTREALKDKCKPFGCMTGFESIRRKRKAAKEHE